MTTTTRTGVARLVIVTGGILMLIASATPWWHVRPGLIEPACTRLKDTGLYDSCQHEAAASPLSPQALQHFTWTAWAAPATWIPVLCLAVLAAVIVGYAVAGSHAGSDLRWWPVDISAALIVVLADLLLVHAALYPPSPGDGIPGPDVWNRDWGLWAALGLAAFITAAAIALTTERQRGSE